MSKNTQQLVEADVNQPIVQAKKITYLNGVKQLRTDSVIAEQPLQIRLSWQEGNLVRSRVFSITMRTPDDDVNLIIGLLFSESVIKSINEIDEICTEADSDTSFENLWEVKLAKGVVPNIATLERYQITYSSCGLCGSTSLKSLELKNPPLLNKKSHWLAADTVCSLPGIMSAQQTLFEQTGGVHAAGLFDGKGHLIDVREDIGRHNALDKLIGALLQNENINRSQLAVLVSGRVSFEIVQKTVMAGIPVLIAVGAPSDLAIAAAKRFDLTLIGFTKANSFNLYHGDWRLQSSSTE